MSPRRRRRIRGDGATKDTPSRRTILPRRGLPGARATVGALLVTLAAAGAFASATHQESRSGTEYVVLLDDVEAGEQLELDDVTLAALTLTPEIAESAARDADGLEGATALRPLRAGAILDRRDVRGAADVDGTPIPGVHEVTLPVPRDRAPTELRRGDRVTVLAFDEEAAVLRTALEDAVVLAYSTEATGIGAGDEARLTVALADAEQVIDAVRWSYQPLTVVLSTGAVDDTVAQSTLLEDPT